MLLLSLTSRERRRMMRINNKVHKNPRSVFILLVLKTSLMKTMIMSLKFSVGVCGLPLETLTLFQPKICDFPFYFRPEPKIDTLFQTNTWLQLPRNGLFHLRKHLRRASNSPLLIKLTLNGFHYNTDINLHHITSHQIISQYITLHYTWICCITLHYTALHWTALHYIALQCSALHCRHCIALYINDIIRIIRLHCRVYSSNVSEYD